MKSCSFLSLSFFSDHKPLYDLSVISAIQLLTDNILSTEISIISSPTNWYEFENGTDIFSCISNDIKDNMRAGVILSKLSQLFGKLSDHTIDNNTIHSSVLSEFDNKYYYSIISSPSIAIENRFNQCKIINSHDDINKIHQLFLAQKPESNADYTIRCHHIFNNILFSHDFSKRLKTIGNGQGIINFSIPITKAISSLNNLNIDDRNMQSIMRKITESCGFECTPQGKNKHHLTYEYTLPDGSTKEINCEFHIKISQDNKQNIMDNYTRIYFGLMPIEHEKIFYILHCGEHL